MSYKPGSKVVCVDDNFDLTDPIIRGMVRPKKDVIYTVRECHGDTILLEEIVNVERPVDLGGIIINAELGFQTKRFAPLQEDREEFADSILNSLGVGEEELELIEIEEVGVV